MGTTKSLEEQKKWVTKMLGYDFEIIYKKGKQNMVVDAFSRKYSKYTRVLLCAISIPQSDWVEEARIEWKQDQNIWNIIQKLQEEPSALDKFMWKNDLLWYQDHLYLCNNSQLNIRSFWTFKLLL
jgi:hypothetical protein